MKIRFKIGKKTQIEFEHHYIVISIFIIFIASIALNNAFITKNNCHTLEIQEHCIQKGVIQRSVFLPPSTNATQYVFIPARISIHHMDEYREKPQFGFLHAECPVGNNTCMYHLDTFNALPEAGLFSVIAHLADNMATNCYGDFIYGSSCFGLPDYLCVIVIWGVIYFGGYYIGTTIYRYMKQR